MATKRPTPAGGLGGSVAGVRKSSRDTQPSDRRLPIGTRVAHLYGDGFHLGSTVAINADKTVQVVFDDGEAHPVSREKLHLVPTAAAVDELLASNVGGQGKKKLGLAPAQIKAAAAKATPRRMVWLWTTLHRIQKGKRILLDTLLTAAAGMKFAMFDRMEITGDFFRKVVVERTLHPKPGFILQDVHGSVLDEPDTPQGILLDSNDTEGMPHAFGQYYIFPEAGGGSSTPLPAPKSPPKGTPSAPRPFTPSPAAAQPSPRASRAPPAQSSPRASQTSPAQPSPRASRTSTTPTAPRPHPDRTPTAPTATPRGQVAAGENDNNNNKSSPLNRPRSPPPPDDPKLSDADKFRRFTKVCKVLMDDANTPKEKLTPPKGLGLLTPGIKFDAAGVKARVKALRLVVYPDCAWIHKRDDAVELSRQGTKACQELDYAADWMAKGRGDIPMNTSTPPPSPMSDAASPTRTPSRGGRGRGRGRGRGGVPETPLHTGGRSAAPPTPYEAFMSMELECDDPDLPALSYILSATCTPRKKPKAPRDPQEQERVDMTKFQIGAMHGSDALAQLHEEGKVGEYALVMERGAKEKHHHGQYAAEIFTPNGLDTAVHCFEALIKACVLTLQYVHVIPKVHDKGDDRTANEAFGYVMKDMPDKPDEHGRWLPFAEQGVYYRDPKPFFFHSNMSLERQRECIFEYRRKNQSPGGQNFAKSGFTWGPNGGKERFTIEPKHLMTWPVSHAKRHGFINLNYSLLKLLCLMFGIRQARPQLFDDSTA